MRRPGKCIQVDFGDAMRAMVLCAGYGTRLGELTREMPKPMLPLQGHPLLEYIIVHLSHYGFTQIAINLHFMPEQICGYFGDGSRWGTDIVYSHEYELLGTAGGIKKMASFLCQGNSFLVQYGDVLTDQDLTAMYTFHSGRQALATLLLHQRLRSNSIVTLDSSSRIIGFWERPDEEPSRTVGPSWVNSALCICDPALLEAIPADQPCDLARDIFPKLVSTGRLYGFPLTGYRCAIDSCERLLEAQEAVADKRCSVLLPRWSVK